MIRPFYLRFLGAALVLLTMTSATTAPQEQRAKSPSVPQVATDRIVFPKDPSVLDAKRDLGAKGDGVTDDTDALQKGIDASCGIGGPTRVLYLPNGVYRVTRTLVVNAAIGPWIYGETRDGVVIRLDDAVKDCNAVIRTHPRESGPTSADWFMRNLYNFTVDVGNNPETDGIRWCATNTGIIKNVRVIRRGKVGINAGFIDQSSPNLIQDVEIDGFETGIVCQWNWGHTLSRVTIRNCRKLGVYVSGTAVGIEDLTVENTPLGLFCDFPNDWTWWGGVVALVNARFITRTPGDHAIHNRSVLYARNVRTRGYRLALKGETPSGDVKTPFIEEYVSHEVKHLFDSPRRALRLPIKREPAVPWETNPSRWVCANDFGAKAGDNQDDSEAIQKAIDTAAAQGKTTVYLRGIGGTDPNWYNLERPVRVHGSVRHIIGLGFGRIMGGSEGRFVVDDRSAPVVKFQNLDAFGGPPVTLENRSASRTLVMESGGVLLVGNGGGDIFATNVSGFLELRKRGQKAWARQLNPEGDSDVGLVQNRGGDLWVLGMKNEGRGIRILTSDGGRTEVLGMFVYGFGTEDSDRRPLFDIVDASLCVMGLREIAFAGNCYPVKVREKRGNEVRTLESDREQGWIGWALYSGWRTPTR
jgi:hypothetical protein